LPGTCWISDLKYYYRFLAHREWGLGELREQGNPKIGIIYFSGFPKGDKGDRLSTTCHLPPATYYLPLTT